MDVIQINDDTTDISDISSNSDREPYNNPPLVAITFDSETTSCTAELLRISTPVTTETAAEKDWNSGVDLENRTSVVGLLNTLGPPATETAFVLEPDSFDVEYVTHHHTKATQTHESWPPWEATDHIEFLIFSVARFVQCK